MEDKMTLRQHQMECVQILLAVQQACRELNLHYYLISGTLLGAVRHRGFIPWDDDIDIAMLRSDYEIFIHQGQTLLGEDYWVQDFHSEPNFPYYFSKVRRKGTVVKEPLLSKISIEQGIYIDIFPLDICPDWDVLGKLFFKAIELLDCAVLFQVCRSFHCGYRKWFMRGLFFLLSHLSKRVLFALREVCRKGAGWLSSGKRLCTVGGRHGFPKETYCSEWFASTEEMEFEGLWFPVPSGWDQTLRNMYGDYMNYPPVCERTGHITQND